MSVKKYLVLTQIEYDFLMEYIEETSNATWAHREPPTSNNFFDKDPEGLVVYHYVDRDSIKYGGLTSEKAKGDYDSGEYINVSLMLGGLQQMETTKAKRDLRFKSYSKTKVIEQIKKDPYNPQSEYDYEFTFFDALAEQDVCIQINEEDIRNFLKENIANLLI